MRINLGRYLEELGVNEWRANTSFQVIYNDKISKETKLKTQSLIEKCKILRNGLRKRITGQ